MADVDMTDAPAAPSAAKGKAAARAGKSGTPSDPAAEGKKRFEVKKVCNGCEPHTGNEQVL